MLKLQLVEDPKYYIKLSSPPITLGRDSNNDFVIHSPHVSDFHAEIHCDDQGLYIVDLLSTGGTFVNDHRVNAQHRLNSWDVIRLATASMEINDPNSSRPGCWVLRKKSDLLSSQFHSLRETTVVGRDPDCDLTIDWHLLSRRHAEIRVEKNQLRIVDLDSRNGTFVNDKRITEGIARANDELRFEEQRYIVVGPANSECPCPDDEDLTGFRESLSNRTQISKDSGDGSGDGSSSNDNDMTSAFAMPRPSRSMPLESPKAFLISSSIHSQATDNVDPAPHRLEPKQHTTLGRASTNHVVIADPGVSKHHATIRFFGDSWLLADNNSRNGLLVNSQPVSEIVLKSGDVISIGTSEIRFEIENTDPDENEDDTIVY